MSVICCTAMAESHSLVFALRLPFSRLLVYHSEALLALVIRLLLAVPSPLLFHKVDGHPRI